MNDPELTEHQLEILDAAMSVGYVLSELLNDIEARAITLPTDELIDTALEVLQKHSRKYLDEGMDTRMAEMLLFFAAGTVRGLRNLIEGIDEELLDEVTNILREEFDD